MYKKTRVVRSSNTEEKEGKEERETEEPEEARQLEMEIRNLFLQEPFSPRNLFLLGTFFS